MSEFVSKQPYPPAARVLLERVDPDKRAEYERRGLIPTNNLGLRMLVLDAGPGSELWDFYHPTLFTDRMLERLERARTLDPELWQAALSAHRERMDMGDKYWKAMQDHGVESVQAREIAGEFTDIEWRDAELRTRIFEIIDQEPLSEEEAIALYR